MQRLTLAKYSLGAKPLYGPFHMDMVNMPWLLESLKSSQKTGYLMFQRPEDLSFVPVFEGRAKAPIPENFEIVSFFQTLENFLVHAFGLHKEHRLPLYSDKPVWVNLESINFNIREFFRKLLDFEVTGYMVVENRVKLLKAFVMLQRGMPVWVSYEESKGEEALRRLLEDLARDVCIIRVYELSEEILSILAFEPELGGVYEEPEGIPLKNLQNALLVSISPERYGYKVYIEGEEVYSEGFEEDAPFFELYPSIKAVALLEPIDVFSMLTETTRLNMVKYDPNTPIIYFCPACWSVVEKDDKVRPNCGYDLTEFHQLPYEYKLIIALEHPVKEMKKNVIYTIGRKDLEMAIPHLEVMINTETDPIILMEIADALSRMSSLEALRLLRALAQHKYPVVRSRARMHLQKKLSSYEA